MLMPMGKYTIGEREQDRLSKFKYIYFSMRKLLLLLFTINVSICFSQNSKFSNKVLLDSICNYITQSDGLLGYFKYWPVERVFTDQIYEMEKKLYLIQ